MERGISRIATWFYFIITRPFPNRWSGITRATDGIITVSRQVDTNRSIRESVVLGMTFDPSFPNEAERSLNTITYQYIDIVLSHSCTKSVLHIFIFLA